jgi:bifunctional UDP-N-acetylglucosamine pyrophosphorylase / glucosamine-1-phosphate N-acetyltransferase
MTLSTPFSVVILAAGKGTRMRSKLHKVLHKVAGHPMLLHLLDTVDDLGASRRVVVVGDGREQVEAALKGRDVAVAVQEPQRGTAHAVQQAREALANFDGNILILYGDTPFVEAATLEAMLERINGPDGPAVAVLASSPADPAHYGRIIRIEGDVIHKMVEYKDATDEERAVRLCNSGMMAVRSADLWRWLDAVGNNNASGEYYLPDIVMIAAREGRTSRVLETEAWQTHGINSRAELAVAEREWQRRRRVSAMLGGASLTDPDSVWFAFDTTIAQDVTVEPHVVFGPGVTIAEGARIRGFSHIEGAKIGPRAEVGPFARLRPGTELGDGAKIGNFVEVKKAAFGPGAKANHLSYIGDATVGAKANIGAGTITCNYDGFGKYPTAIGEGAFIGSNSALVAPVIIGDGAIVGAGSVITKNVEGDALGVARADQRGIAGWAKRFRTRKAAK